MAASDGQQDNLPAKLNQALTTLDLRPLAAKHNVLGPTQVFASEGLKVRAVMRELSPDPDGPDVYRSPSGGGKLALSKIGLLKLASDLGIVWSPTLSAQVQDAPPCEACVAADRRRCPHNVGFRAVGAWLDPTGQWQVHSATRYWLYDEEKAEVERLYRKQIADGRLKQADFEARVRDEFNKRLKDRLANAETKAKLRAVREAGIQAAYTPEEIAKGFVIVRVEADLTADEVRARGTAATAAIFGAPLAPQAALPAPDWSRVREAVNGEDEQPPSTPLRTGEAAQPDEAAKREALVTDMSDLWEASFQAQKKGQVEDMPPKPPRKDAPIGEIEAWIKSCRSFLATATEGGAQ